VLIDILEPVVINCYNENPPIAFSTDATSASYRWFRDGVLFSNSSSVSAGEAGEYVLQITDLATLCNGADTVQITTDLIPPLITIPYQDTLSCLRPIVAISGIEISDANNYTASWATLNGHFADDSQTLFTSVDSAGLYTLTVISNSNGCSAQKSISVFANENIRFDSRSLAFPNVFSPNGDEKNAVWKPFLLDDPSRDISNFLTDYELHIYNRWGSEVFNSKRSETQWRGDDAAEGVYFYTIQFNTVCGSGQKFNDHGSITLVR
jgi:gliding motility-associated-like protein